MPMNTGEDQMPDIDDHWEEPEVVQRFADREPDRRLQELVEKYGDPAGIRVLDAGCAGGRNTVFLAEGSFDVHAMDGAEAMVAETRRRIEPLVGRDEADERVRVGLMTDLPYDDESFDLIVSLGLLHNARSWGEWKEAAAESARVLRTGGRLLLSQFTPRTDLTGEGVRPVPGDLHLYDGFPRGLAVLLEPEEVDRAMAPFGLHPEVPTEVGVTKKESGQRVSANALYRKGTQAG